MISLTFLLHFVIDNIYHNLFHLCELYLIHRKELSHRMNTTITPRLAQQIASTVKDVCGQNINFIDIHGIIYASTTEMRIGDFHEIGLQVASSGSTIEVYENDTFHGTNEGINIPVFRNGTIISVIGISGNPEEVRKYAHLALRITKLLIREHELETLNRSKKEIENYLIRTLTKEEHHNWGYLLPALNEYKITEKSRLKAVVIRLKSRYNIMNLPLIEHSIYELFEQCGMTLSTFDYPNEYIALLPEILSATAEPLLRKFADAHSQIMKIVIGNSQSIFQLKESYQFCEIALRCTHYNNHSMITFDDMDLGIVLGSMSRKYKQLYCNKTVSCLSPEEIELLTVYYEENMSLARTCDRLFLHKNTLQYRLDRIHRNCGYNPRNFRHAVILYLALKMVEHE